MYAGLWARKVRNGLIHPDDKDVFSGGFSGTDRQKTMKKLTRRRTAAAAAGLAPFSLPQDHLERQTASFSTLRPRIHHSYAEITDPTRTGRPSLLIANIGDRVVYRQALKTHLWGDQFGNY